MMLERYVREGEVIAARLADAVQKDGTGDFRDEALIELLDSVRGVDDSFDRLKLATLLIGLARRIESSGVDYSNLVRTAAELAGSRDGTPRRNSGGSEHEQALHVSKTIIRPLAEEYVRADDVGRSLESY